MAVLARFAPFLVLAATACGGSASDASDQATDQNLTGAQHISAGVERARQARAGGVSPADVQRASVHLGNAYWLAQLSMLSYQDEHGIRAGLAAMGFSPQEFHFFESHCSDVFPTDSIAYYFSQADYSVLVYRGTLDWADWGTNFESTKVYWGGPGTVHYGFVSRFHALWDPHPDCGDKDGIAAVLAARHRIDPRTGKAPGGQLYVTGHSMGGALANLTLAHTQAEVCGDDVGCATAPRVDMSALYTFGSPKVGNETFAYATAARARGRTPIYRFVNGDDVVTGIPRDLDPIESVISDYRHVGYAGEGEDIFQVWLGDRTMSISSFVLHLLVNKDDHLKYLPPLEFQAKARNEMH